MQTTTKTDFQLSEDQLHSLEVIKETFIVNRTNENYNDTYLVLQGEAGTGKTTVMRQVKDLFYRIIYAAPTNAAASVLEDKVEQEVFTIHKILGLQPGLDLADFDPLDPKFVFKGGIDKEIIENAQLLVIDEASMINDWLLLKLLELPVSILFVGDREQLKPVKNKGISSLFTDFDCVELTTVQRQKKNSKAYEIAQKARKQEYDFELTSSLDFLEEVDISQLIALTYTNKRMEYWTNLIRRKLLPTAYFPNGKEKASLVVGEHIIMRQDNQFYGLKNNIEFEIKELTMTSSKTKEDIEIFYKLITLYNPKKGEIKVRLLNPISYTAFSEILGEIYFQCKSRRMSWVEYYKVKEYFLTEKDLYYNRVQIAKRDFQYNYACTTHKAQGSTKKIVLVDLEDILKCRDNELKKQLITVACSRASDQTLIYKPNPLS